MLPCNVTGPPRACGARRSLTNQLDLDETVATVKGTCAAPGCDRATKALGLCQSHYMRVRRTGSLGLEPISLPGRTVTERAESRCAVDGCDRLARTHGWCSAHYDRWLFNGEPGTAQLKRPPVGECAVDGCTRSAKTRGWCRGHYQRVLRDGQPGPDDFPVRVAVTTLCSVESCDRTVRAKGLCGTHYRRQRETGHVGPAEIKHQRSAPAPCAVAGCGQRAKSGEFCDMHYERWKRNGDPGPAGLVHKPMGPCQLPGCGDPREAFGYCKKHYRRYRRYGDPETVVHSRWLGDDVGYEGVHIRIRDERGPASDYFCKHCGKIAEDWAYDHCDRHEKHDEIRGLPYSTDAKRYIPLCKSCHQRFDRSLSVSATIPPKQWPKIRAWAKDNGYRVGSRSRLSQKVIVAYLEAHASA